MKRFNFIKGVSPVIGTLLLVMIVVVLAAALAAYTTGLVYKVKRPEFSAFVVSDAPSKITSSGGDLVIAVLYGGEPIPCRDLEFQIVNLSSYSTYTFIWNETIKCFVCKINSSAYMFGYGDDIKDSFVSVGDMITFNETVGVIRSGTPVEFRVIYLPTQDVIYVKDIIVT